jgi:tripartite-type tricarboxylate transporter receptor subunit TctC
MKLSRRQFLHLAAGAATLPVVSRGASAQTYPTRSVRIIVGAPPGGGSDISARLIGQWLTERLGQPFIVENRPGGGGTISTEAVVKAPPDGYTLLLVQMNDIINTTLVEKLNFDFIRDIAAVASIDRVPGVMEVHPSVPAESVTDFIAYAKAHPGKINLAAGFKGSTQHINGEIFKKMTGIDMVPVFYRGATPALADLLAGQVHVMFDGMGSSLEHIRAGKLRALAVTTATRSDLLPDIPTVGDYLSGFEASNLHGIGAPRNTPPAIIETLNKEINAGLADTKLKARLSDLGAAPLVLSRAEFAKLLADETDKWGKAIRAANIKPE